MKRFKYVRCRKIVPTDTMGILDKETKERSSTNERYLRVMHSDARGLYPTMAPHRTFHRRDRSGCRILNPGDQAGSCAQACDRANESFVVFSNWRHQVLNMADRDSGPHTFV
jgi:hypothetical protein